MSVLIRLHNYTSYVHKNQGFLQNYLIFIVLYIEYTDLYAFLCIFKVCLKQKRR